MTILTHIAAFLVGIYFAVICYRIRRAHDRQDKIFKVFERRVRLWIDPVYRVESEELTEQIELHEN